jgi:hypothetical protein
MEYVGRMKYISQNPLPRSINIFIEVVVRDIQGVWHFKGRRHLMGLVMSVYVLSFTMIKVHNFSFLKIFVKWYIHDRSLSWLWTGISVKGCGVELVFWIRTSIAPKTLNYLAFQSFDFERTWWRLVQKRVVRTTFDIYIFISLFRVFRTHDFTPKNHVYQLPREARKFLRYFVWKITILRQKIIFFLQF